MKIKNIATHAVVGSLLLALSSSWAMAEAKRRPFRSPGKQRAPVAVSIATELDSPGIGQAIPLVVEATPSLSTEALYLRVQLPEGVQLLTGRDEWGPEYVPAGETRRLELQVIVLQPGIYTVPVFASIRVGQSDLVGISAMKINTGGAAVAPPPMLRQKMPGQAGYDKRYKTVVGTVIE